ncbi:phenylacetone monooxygenase [Paraphoma chrysanthemicola]|uniref:Phenylacetone monooxygenase n=1 Tax=Paraphoma chrysanthemicola TaxID=798071 RepID=A0A8K0R687_9PLEO|nr:phenylacetone monooxygenase [Paraphoma chrysanthemicola]
MTARYTHERTKRFKKAGMEQYHHVVGSKSSVLPDLVQDQFVEPGFKRDPVTEEHDIVIAGGGVGGIIMACRLVKAGFKNIKIIERGGDFGGVWYWNRYPGIQIDIESYIYMPMLEDTGYIPTRKYAYGNEIFQYLCTLARHFGLYDKVLFQTGVRAMRWNESTLRWNVETTRDDLISAKFLVSAVGPFNIPKFPGIPGIELFKGKSMHTSRWDYEYTGGDTEGNLTKLSDKRVGIIGTGATSIQVTPHLGKWAKELYVFQRTPSSIDLRNNQPTDIEHFKSLPAGWQRERMDNFAAICTGHAVKQDLVNDGWTESLQALTGWFGQSKTGHTSSATPEETAKALQMADYMKTESIRKRVDQIVKDPVAANALKPYFNLFCKRPCFHDDYLPTFNRPSVTMVDTNGQGVDRVTEKGIVVGDKEYELDCIIYATGFEFNTDWKIRNDLNMYGVDGQDFNEKYSDGPITLHGWGTNGFPNCFIVNSSQNAGFPNYHQSLDDQAAHLVHIFSKVRDENIERFEVTKEAEQAWLDEIIRISKDRTAFLLTCTPGYYNDEGAPGEKTARNSPYGGNPATFLQIAKDWRDENKLEGVSVRYASAQA